MLDLGKHRRQMRFRVVDIERFHGNKLPDLVYLVQPVVYMPEADRQPKKDRRVMVRDKCEFGILSSDFTWGNATGSIDDVRL